MSTRSSWRRSIAYEDRRFREHRGIDLQALVRAAVQFVRHGRPVSGASTLTMQVARLLDGAADPQSVGGKISQMLMALALERRAHQGRDPRPLPDARALWRQHRGHPRRDPRLFRQGAAAADGRRGGAARRAAAVARGAAPRPRRRRRRTPRATAFSTAPPAPASLRRDGCGGGADGGVPTARRDFPMLAAHAAERAIAAAPEKPITG